MGSRVIHPSSPSDLTQVSLITPTLQTRRLRLQNSDYMPLSIRGRKMQWIHAWVLEPDPRELSPMLPGFVSGSAIYYLIPVTEPFFCASVSFTVKYDSSVFLVGFIFLENKLS